MKSRKERKKEKASLKSVTGHTRAVTILKEGDKLNVGNFKKWLNGRKISFQFKLDKPYVSYKLAIVNEVMNIASNIDDSNKTILYEIALVSLINAKISFLEFIMDYKDERYLPTCSEITILNDILDKYRFHSSEELRIRIINRNKENNINNSLK